MLIFFFFFKSKIFFQKVRNFTYISCSKSDETIRNKTIRSSKYKEREETNRSSNKQVNLQLQTIFRKQTQKSKQKILTDRSPEAIKIKVHRSCLDLVLLLHLLHSNHHLKPKTKIRIKIKTLLYRFRLYRAINHSNSKTKPKYDLGQKTSWLRVILYLKRKECVNVPLLLLMMLSFYVVI